MRNVRQNQLRKCILLDAQELQAILSAVYEMDIYVDAYPDCLMYETNNRLELDIDDNDICDALSKYYDINVLSIHTDDACDVWISYKEER